MTILAPSENGVIDIDADGAMISTSANPFTGHPCSTAKILAQRDWLASAYLIKRLRNKIQFWLSVLHRIDREEVNQKAQETT